MCTYVLQPHPVQINLVIESSIVCDLSQLTAAHQLYLSPLLHAYGQMAPRFPETPSKLSSLRVSLIPILALLVTATLSTAGDTWTRVNKLVCWCHRDHLLGCELWTLDDSRINEFGVTWRKAVTRILNVPCDPHNNIYIFIHHRDGSTVYITKT